MKSYVLFDNVLGEENDFAPATMKLWLGPKGTLTPLHHDLHSILFAQVFGKKHIKLIPPFDTAFVYPGKRFYSPVDPENVDAARLPEFLKGTVLDVFVEPGDVLFAGRLVALGQSVGRQHLGNFL